MKVKLTMNAKFEFGIWPSWAPIGYENVDNENFTCDLDKKIVVPHPEQSKLVKDTFQNHSTANFSISELCDEMYGKGLTTKKGNKLSVSSMQQLLSNPFYYGLMRRNGEEKMGKHEALISKALFDRCQYVLAKKRHFLVRKRKYKFLLNGFLFCSDHGTRLGGEWQNNLNSKNRDKISYYHCFHRGGCKGSYIEKEKLERMIANRVKRYQFSDQFIKIIETKLKERLEEHRSDFESKRQALINQKIALEARRKKAENHLLDDVITEESYQRISKDIEHQLNVIKSNITDFESQQTLDFDLIREVLGLTRNLYESYQEAPDFIKKRYLRLLFEGIYIKDRKVVKLVENPMFFTLRKQHQVLIRHNWLPG
jgi:site-specific DNA recombinase